MSLRPFQTNFLQRLKSMFSRDMIQKKGDYDAWVEQNAELADRIEYDVVERGVEEYYELKASEAAEEKGEEPGMPICKREGTYP